MGKATISSSSRLRFFFGLTVRNEGPSALLLGQAVLRPHHLNKKQYDSYGFFASTTPPHNPEPFTDSGEIASFVADFGLERGSLTGLSLVIPFHSKDLTPDALVEAAVRNCFHQIASGSLIVRVNEVQLDKDSILAVINNRPSMQRFIPAVQMSLQVSANQPAIFTPSMPQVTDALTEKDFDAASLVTMRRIWNDGGIVGVEAPIQIRPGEGPAVPGIFRLYLRREATAENAIETYVRGRVAVRAPARIQGKSAIGLLVADRGIVSKFLGDSENPSHTKWVGTRAKDSGYKDYARSLRVIQNGLRDLHAIVAQDAQAAEVKDALKDFFWTPKPNVPKEKKIIKKKTPPEVQPGLDLFDVAELKGGFRVKYKESAKETSPPIRISLAYDVRHGKPKWNENDFDLRAGTIDVAAQGKGKYDRIADGLKITEAKPGYTLTVKGFDKNRDLRVRVEMHDAGA